MAHYYGMSLWLKTKAYYYCGSLLWLITTMAHFSKYIRPGAEVIGVENGVKDLMVTAATNPDGSIAVVLFNEGKTPKDFTLSLGEDTVNVKISQQAIQTILIPSKTL